MLLAALAFLAFEPTLGAHLRLGDVAAAAAAYRRPLQQDKMPVEPLVKSQIETQLALLARPGISAADIKPLRNPWME